MADVTNSSGARLWSLGSEAGSREAAVTRLSFISGVITPYRPAIIHCNTPYFYNDLIMLMHLSRCAVVGRNNTTSHH